MTDKQLQAEREANEIASSVMSPYCPGRTLSACPSSQAIELRGEIEGWLVTEAITPEQVRTRLEQRFGDLIEGKPKFLGIGALAWLVPGAFVAILLLLILFRLKRLRSKPGKGTKTEALSSDQRRALEDELDTRLRPYTEER